MCGGMFSGWRLLLVRSCSGHLSVECVGPGLKINFKVLTRLHERSDTFCATKKRVQDRSTHFLVASDLIAEDNGHKKNLITRLGLKG